MDSIEISDGRYVEPPDIDNEICMKHAYQINIYLTKEDVENMLKLFDKEKQDVN